jgi:hypothetical protein
VVRLTGATKPFSIETADEPLISPKVRHLIELYRAHFKKRNSEYWDTLCPREKEETIRSLRTLEKGLKTALLHHVGEGEFIYASSGDAAMRIAQRRERKYMKNPELKTIQSRLPDATPN